MPNWCECELDVWGPREELSEFYLKAKWITPEGNEEPLSLNNFVPMPKELENTQSPPDKQNKELIKKYGADNWWDWCVTNWGSKWEITDGAVNRSSLFHLEIDKNNRFRKLMYGFSTAWSPPEPVIKEMGKMFPKLKFKLQYWEGGMGFSGILVINKGKIIKNETYEYSGRKGG